MKSLRGGFLIPRDGLRNIARHAGAVHVAVAKTKLRAGVAVRGPLCQFGERFIGCSGNRDALRRDRQRGVIASGDEDAQRNDADQPDAKKHETPRSAAAPRAILRQRAPIDGHAGGGAFRNAIAFA